MDASDMAYRAAGGLMVLSGLWNMFMSAVWFLSLIWVCVGAFWLIPGLLSLAYAGLGVYLVATGRQLKLAAFGPLLGLAISLMNLNILGGSLDLLALVLGIVGFTQVPKELEG
jgi:hypothetical protein